MELSFNLKKQDFVSYYMSVEGKSKKIRNRMLAKQFVAPLLYFIMGTVMKINYDKTTIMLSLYFLAVMWILIYPVVFKLRLNNYYNSYVLKNHSNSINELTEIKLEKEFFIMQSGNIETKHYLAEIDKKIEASSHIFLLFKDKSFVILPKNSIPGNKLNLFLKQIGT